MSWAYGHALLMTYAYAHEHRQTCQSRVLSDCDIGRRRSFLHPRAVSAAIAVCRDVGMFVLENSFSILDSFVCPQAT